MRNIAFDVLNDVNEKKIFVNLRLKDLDSNNCDINNITIRVYGVLQNYNFLEYKVLETTKDKKIDHKTKLILMMAIFEKMFLDNTPEYAIISEYTNLAARKNQKAKKFISYYLNNVLDEAVNAYPKFKNQEKNESIIYSMPQWIVKKIKLQYEDDYLQILESMNKKKNISARVINKLSKPEEFESFLFPDLVRCKTNIIKTNDFEEKNILIQDVGSYLITKYLKPIESDMVLDMCAAPGNKTLHIAETCKFIYANEINEKRFELLKKNTKDKKNIAVLNCDATSKNMLDFELKDVKFDKILIDAPCSGWGVFRSKPEMKIYQDSMEVSEIIKVQKQILRNAINYLAPGGEIVYSTCTINKEENEDVIIDFLNEFDFEVKREQDIELICGVDGANGITLKPIVFDSDGFYMCKLKRK